VSKKLHVGNLTSSVSSSDLREWLAPFGTVQSAQVVSNRATGRSKGFGFVEMETDAQAHAAIYGLHEQDHDGRRLMVSEAKPRVARTRSFAGGSIDGNGAAGGGGGYGGYGNGGDRRN
jgi:RNA recognition motif-containing protein